MHNNFSLIVVAISVATICVNAALDHQSVTKELEIYRNRVSLFYDTFKKECPEEALLIGQLTKREVIGHLADNDNAASILLEHEKAFLNKILQKIIECREKKTKNTATNPASTASNITAKPISTTNPTTTPHHRCLHTTGYTKMIIDLVGYHNPSNKQATGRQCDDRLGCNLYLEICVSAVTERNCSYYYQITEGVGQGSVVSFTSDIGGSANPVILDLGERKWEGVNILVTVRDKNINQKTDDMVDEFSYDAVNSPGSLFRNVNLPSSVKRQPKSSLTLALKTYCPSPLTTTTTTPTTTTTTIPPVPKACASAVNLTEAWRRDYTGSRLRPVNGRYNCDFRAMTDQGRPWFRFSGAAGNRLLDKCPLPWSCGTIHALWSSDPMPADVAVETRISVSLSQGDGSDSCKPHRTYSRVSVMRCSSRQDDFIYRYDDNSSGCYYGFCGMN